MAGSTIDTLVSHTVTLGTAGYGGGGTGVDLNGGNVTNTGTISGGVGYYYQGGTGVYVNGRTVTNAGTIAGGLSSDNGYQDIAVRFGGPAGTLIVDPGAVFIGQIDANTAVNDVLALAGASAATLTGLGKNGSETAASLHFTGSYTTADFHLASDGHGGTMITFV